MPGAIDAVQQAGEADAGPPRAAGLLERAAAFAALSDLRRQLPAGIGLWAGGSIWHRSRRKLEGVDMIDDLAGIPEALGAWRAAAGIPGGAS